MGGIKEGVNCQCMYPKLTEITVGERVFFIK